MYSEATARSRPTEMPVLEKLRKLVGLQHLDSQLNTLEQEFGAIPEKRRVIAESRSQCDVRLEAVSENLTATELGQRQLELQMQEHETLLSRLEGQQNQVKSNEAYTALLHEMDQAKQAISDCETQILESMEALETARDTQTSEESEVGTERKRIDIREKTLDDRETQLTSEIERLHFERERACGDLAGELLDRYQKILARRQPALVLVTGETCTGCRVGIPAQDFIEILKAERLVTCESCQRILLHEEKVGG